MSTRVVNDRWALAGVRQIAVLNWPRYVWAGMVGAAAGLALATLEMPGALRWGVALAGGTALWWVVASMTAPWWVYDVARVLDAGWLAAYLPRRPASWVNIHAGLDQTTGGLLREFPAKVWRVLDIYERSRMSESSIARARQWYSTRKGERASVDRLPVGDAEVEAVFMIMAAHEVRDGEDRRRLFAEVKRVLVAGGVAVVVEHDRDVANFIAFGPGFLHFIARRLWLRAASDAGLVLHREARRAGLVRVMVWEKPVRARGETWAGAKGGGR